MLTGVSSIPGMLLFWMAVGAVSALSVKKTQYTVVFASGRKLRIGVAAALAMFSVYIGSGLYIADEAFSQALCASGQGDFEKAALLYERSYQLSQYNDFYLSSTAESYIDWSRWAKDEKLLDYAVDRLVQARALNPYEIDNTLLLANAYLVGAKFFDPEYGKSARSEIEYLAEREGDSPMVRYLSPELGMVSGENDLAMVHLEKALQADPSFEPAKELLKKIQEAEVN